MGILIGVSDGTVLDRPHLPLDLMEALAVSVQSPQGTPVEEILEALAGRLCKEALRVQPKSVYVLFTDVVTWAVDGTGTWEGRGVAAR